MSLSTYALVSVDELKEVLSIEALASNQDVVLEGVINRASEAIEAYLNRDLVTRGSKTEYHSIPVPSECFLSLQCPVTTVTSVTEGYWYGGSWVTLETLTLGDDYVYDAAIGRFIRLGTPWRLDRDGVKLVYTAGYANTAAVPAAIKDVCLSLAARKYSQIRRGGDFSAQTVTDAVGSVSRFLPAELLNMEKEGLGLFARFTFEPTGRVA